MHPEHRSRVFAAAADAASLEELKRLELEVLEDGHIGAEGAVERGELETHGAGADHDDGFGDPVELERLVAGDHVGRDLDVGEEPGSRSRGEHDLPRVHATTVDLHAGPGGQACGPVQDVDPPSLHEAGQTLHVLVDDRVLEATDRAPVRLAGGLDAPLRGPVDRVQHGRGLQQGLRGDAPPIKAHATETIALHNSHLSAQLRGANGCHISAWSSANDDHLKLLIRCRHLTSLRLYIACWTDLPTWLR